MSKDLVDEREFELINIIGAELGSNQRDLSRQMELSLGSTNMLIKRLIAKGYIRITQLDKRKVKYLLTPKGFSEKMRKSVKYTLKTISSIGLIRKRIRKSVLQLHSQGERIFTILGTSDLALLVEMILKELNLDDFKVTYIEELPREPIEGVLLICKENVSNGHELSSNTVDLIHELAKDHSLMSIGGEAS